MDSAGKPYLVLQLDDHDSSVGYETRIEAALRSFRNHAAGPGKEEHSTPLPPVPAVQSSVGRRTLLMPCWDPVVQPLLQQALRRNGFDVCLLKEDKTSIQRSTSLNRGQCLPLTAIVHEAVETVRRDGLDPARIRLTLKAQLP